MPETAYVFPGQGAQKVGMGLDLFQEFSAARRVFEQADDALGFCLSSLIFEGPSDTLKQTVNAQPAVFVVSLACFEAAREALGSSLPPARCVAGHSLGEYTALVVGNAISLADGVRLVRERGRLMQDAGERQPGTMIAVLGMDPGDLEVVCRDAGAELANINCPGQIVISGTRADVDRAVQLAQAMAGKRFMPLEVSGAFHSRWMGLAHDGLKRAIEACCMNPLDLPLVANVSAQCIMSPDDIRYELSAQLCGCVRWQDGVENMLGLGVTEFIEFGPGQVLSGLIKRTSREARTRNVGSAADLKNWTG